MHVIHIYLQNESHSIYVVSLALKGSVLIFFQEFFASNLQAAAEKVETEKSNIL